MYRSLFPVPRSGLRRSRFPNTVLTATRTTRDVLSPLHHGAEELGEKPLLGDADLRKLLRNGSEHAFVLTDERLAAVRQRVRLGHVAVGGQELGKQLRPLVERQRGELLFRARRNALPLRPEELDHAVRATLLAHGVEQRRERGVVRPRKQALGCFG